jgi:hypothetical protein
MLSPQPSGLDSPPYRAAVSAGFYSDRLSAQLLYHFTAAELARLMVYKAAIAAGLYSDQLNEDNWEA